MLEHIERVILHCIILYAMMRATNHLRIHPSASAVEVRDFMGEACKAATRGHRSSCKILSKFNNDSLCLGMLSCPCRGLDAACFLFLAFLSLLCLCRLSPLLHLLLMLPCTRLAASNTLSVSVELFLQVPPDII